MSFSYVWPRPYRLSQSSLTWQSAYAGWFISRHSCSHHQRLEVLGQVPVRPVSGVSPFLGCRLLTCILTWREQREEASSLKTLMSIHLTRRLHLHHLPKVSPLNDHIGGWVLTHECWGDTNIQSITLSPVSLVGTILVLLWAPISEITFVLSFPSYLNPSAQPPNTAWVHPCLSVPIPTTTHQTPSSLTGCSLSPPGKLQKEWKDINRTRKQKYPDWLEDLGQN